MFHPLEEKHVTVRSISIKGKFRGFLLRKKCQFKTDVKIPTKLDSFKHEFESFREISGDGSLTILKRVEVSQNGEGERKSGGYGKIVVPERRLSPGSSCQRAKAECGRKQADDP